MFHFNRAPYEYKMKCDYRRIVFTDFNYFNISRFFYSKIVWKPRKQINKIREETILFILVMLNERYLFAFCRARLMANREQVTLLLWQAQYYWLALSLPLDGIKYVLTMEENKIRTEVQMISCQPRDVFQYVINGNTALITYI